MARSRPEELRDFVASVRTALNQSSGRRTSAATSQALTQDCLDRHARAIRACLGPHATSVDKRTLGANDKQ